MDLFNNFSVNFKIVLISVLLIILVLLSLQRLLLFNSNTINHELCQLQYNIVNFEKTYSKISEDINTVEGNSSFNETQKIKKIQNTIVPVLHQIVKNGNLRRMTFYSFKLNIGFNVLSRNNRYIYSVSSNSIDNIKENDKQNINYSFGKNIINKRLFYHNGKPTGYIIIEKEIKRKNMFLNLLPQILLYFSILLVIIYFLYKYIKKTMIKSIYTINKHLNNYTSKKHVCNIEDEINKNIPEEFHPIFLNIMLILRKFETVMHEFSRASAVKELLPVVAHEVKSPISVIKGNAQIGLKTDSEKRIDEIFSKINKNCDIVNRFITESIQLVTPSKNNKKEIFMEDLIDDILVIIEPMVNLAGIKFDYNIEENMPSIKIDRVNISHVVINIIKNAVEATPRGGIIILKTYIKNDNIYISVEDNGCGISQEMKDKIFEKYFTTKKNKGTGIGLALAHNVVKDHGGDMWFNSTKGVGTTFYIKLPLK